MIKAEAVSTMVAGTTIVGWFVNLLPPLAAFLSVIWLSMQIIMNWTKFSAAVAGFFRRFKQGD